MAFVTGERGEGCFICEAVSSDDDDSSHVLGRSKLHVVILNTYPYNTGHVMVAPLRHVGDLHDLSPEERGELMDLTARCVDVIKEEFSPQGFNLGANLGEIAGAGLPGHFHMHIVPRWTGDTNFMPVIGKAKVIPEILDETYRRLRGRIVT